MHNDAEILLLVVLAFVVPGIVGGAILSRSGRGGLGFLVGLLLGWIGVVVAVTIREWPALVAGRTAYSYRDCPHCGGRMRRDSSDCPHCSKTSEAWAKQHGVWWVQLAGDWYWLDERAGTWRPFEPAEA